MALQAGVLTKAEYSETPAHRTQMLHTALLLGMTLAGITILDVELTSTR